MSTYNIIFHKILKLLLDSKLFMSVLLFQIIKFIVNANSLYNYNLLKEKMFISLKVSIVKYIKSILYLYFILTFILKIQYLLCYLVYLLTFVFCIQFIVNMILKVILLFKYNF